MKTCSDAKAEFLHLRPVVIPCRSSVISRGGSLCSCPLDMSRLFPMHRRRPLAIRAFSKPVFQSGIDEVSRIVLSADFGAVVDPDDHIFRQPRRGQRAAHQCKIPIESVGFEVEGAARLRKSPNQTLMTRMNADGGAVKESIKRCRLSCIHYRCCIRGFQHSGAWVRTIRRPVASRLAHCLISDSS